MILLYGTHRVCPSFSLALVLLRLIPTQCVSQCLVAHILDGSKRVSVNESQPARNKTHPFEIKVLPYFQQNRPDLRIENNITTGRQKKQYFFQCRRSLQSLLVSLFLKLRDVKTTTVFVNKNDLLWVLQNLRGQLRSSKTRCTDNTINKEGLKL